jgi:LmbE family N-acetylglucosaminyl deacetylase
MQGIEAFDDVKRAIVVCAHADDMETMMGGTVWLLKERGVEFYELILTQGDLGTTDPAYTRESLSALRREEARSAIETLGLRDVVTLDHHDGELEPSLDVRAQVAYYYRLWQPDTLFTFDPNWHGQIHPDHRAAGRAAVDAFMPSKMPLYRPEQLGEVVVAKLERAYFFSPTEAGIAVDVTDVYPHKMVASIAHLSQFPEGEKNLEWMRALDTQAAARAGMEGRLVEAFTTLRLW